MDHRKFRIGAFSRRVDVSPETLRAWERRYGLFAPSRSEGGFRLYSADDERRAVRMKELLAAGMSAAEAAREVLAPAPTVPPAPAAPPEPALAPEPMLGELGDRLSRTLDAFDGPGAHATLDELLAAFDMDTLLSHVLMPYLHELGERWARAEITVAQEHFASRLIHGRLLALARGWEQGGGPLAVVTCAPREQHDLGAIAFGLALHRRGWRIAFLGADTPVMSVREMVATLDPALVVMSATAPRRFSAVAGELAVLADECRLALAGAGARMPVAREIGAEVLDLDPVGAADRVAAA